ncbi:MAG: protein-L-isoaspartate O-methyltransferase, partial [Candidatus Polarisedimenticolia bacterium]
YGWAANAPYRAIVVTAAGPEVPEPLLRQLEEVARLVMPLARGAEQRLVSIERDGARLRETDHGAVDFVPLIGRYGFAADGAAKR